MSPLEIALVVLVSIWSAIFLIIAVATVILVREVKKGLDKVNRIIDSAEEVAEGFGSMSKLAGAGLSGFMARFGVDAVKKVMTKTTGRKKK